MKVFEYLNHRQKQVLHIFEATFERQRVPHAFLLSGEKGIPLKEVAIFLAKSFVCDSPSPLACESCLSCQRIENFTNQDFIFIDGEENTIKKEQIQMITSSFNRTPLEEKGIMIYVIHLVENMNEYSTNALLKFLEEPKPNTYAILTTENVARLLPTIRSRCEEVRFRLAPRKEIVQETIKLGAKIDDAELLSSIANSGELIVELSKEETVKKAKDCFLLTLKAFHERKEDIVYNLEREVISPLKGKEEARYFLQFLATFFKDTLSKKGDLQSYIDEEQFFFQKFSHLAKNLELILQAQGDLKRKIQPSLVLEHTLRSLVEDMA